MGIITDHIRRECTVADYLNQKYNTDINLSKEDLDVNQLMQLCDRMYTDTYTYTKKCVDRLINDYKHHKSFIIAYDYDDTVVPSNNTIDTSRVQSILRFCSKCNFTMICFTARDKPEQIEEARTTLKKLGIRCDYINEDCDNTKQNMDVHATSFHKIFYNVFLDDRAGLHDAVRALVGFLKWYVKQPLRSTEDEKSNASDIKMFGG